MKRIRKLSWKGGLWTWLCRCSWRLYGRSNFSVSAYYSGRRRIVPLMHHLGLHLLSFYDHGLEAIIRGLMAQGREGTFVDVGVNCGQSLLTLRSVSDLAYVGFEPDLTAAFYVRTLISQNRFARCEVIPVALGSRNCRATLHSNGHADASATLGLDLRPPQMYVERTSVAVCRGDEQISPVDPIFMIKIDVEGLELEVLLGLQRTISTRRPPVFFEVMGYGHLLSGSYPRKYFGGELSPAEIERLVENRRGNMAQLRIYWDSLGYRLFRVLENGTLRPVSTLDAPDSPGEMNFLAIPSEAAPPENATAP